jgi:hypothetical protein
MLGRGNDGARQIKRDNKIENHCVITSFVICTLQKKSLGRLNEVGWDGLDTHMKERGPFKNLSEYLTRKDRFESIDEDKG